MKIISHRGNLNGKDEAYENSIEAVSAAINYGFDVEVDVWYNKNKFYLGHDEPQYEVEIDFLLNDKIWCHAKSSESLHQLISNDIHCFWHQKDDFTITSRKIVWCYPGKICSNGIVVSLGGPVQFKTSVYGICTDDPIAWRDFQLSNQGKS